MTYYEDSHNEDDDLHHGNQEVKFTIPVPDKEDLIEEVSRQILAGLKYKEKDEIEKCALNKIHEEIERTVSSLATPIIHDLLAKNITPTDGFGNKTGDPTSFQGVLANRISLWANEVVDSEGKPSNDSYRTKHKRIEWYLATLVNSELKKAVDQETNKIVSQFKSHATETIAKQIAEKISGLVIK